MGHLTSSRHSSVKVAIASVAACGALLGVASTPAAHAAPPKPAPSKPAPFIIDTIAAGFTIAASTTTAPRDATSCSLLVMPGGLNFGWRPIPTQPPLEGDGPSDRQARTNVLFPFAYRVQMQCNTPHGVAYSNQQWVNIPGPLYI